EPENGPDRCLLLIQTNDRVVLAHRLGHMAGDRADDHRIDPRAASQVVERAAQPVHREAAADLCRLARAFPRAAKAAREAQLPVVGRGTPTPTRHRAPGAGPCAADVRAAPGPTRGAGESHAVRASFATPDRSAS